MIDPAVAVAREHMKKAIEVTRQDLSSVRSGRATPALIENVSIAAYGGTARMRVQELATITSVDSRTLLVVPFDPSTTHEIEKGIMEANVGLTPVVDGEAIRISIPALTEERRLEYNKLAKTKVEAGKVMVRQIRAEGMKDIKKLLDDKKISEDEQAFGEKQIQELTDEMIAELEVIGEKKEQELMQI